MTETRSQSKLQEMVIRGKDYREDYEFEMFGEEVTGVIRPLPDKEFLPLAAFLADHFDMDADDLNEDEVVDEAIDEIEEAREDGGDIDVSKLDEEFVATMQSAAILGLEGGYDDAGNYVEYSEADVEEIVTNMIGGYSVELGGEVLDLSGNVRDADRFRGNWGRKHGDSVKQ